MQYIWITEYVKYETTLFWNIFDVIRYNLISISEELLKRILVILTVVNLFIAPVSSETACYLLSSYCSPEAPPVCEPDPPKQEIRWVNCCAEVSNCDFYISCDTEESVTDLEETNPCDGYELSDEDECVLDASCVCFPISKDEQELREPIRYTVPSVSKINRTYLQFFSILEHDNETEFDLSKSNGVHQTISTTVLRL